MLMAAGVGTRLRPFTDWEPKPLIPLMGIPCAQFNVDHLIDSGISQIVVNLHHLARRCREGFESMDCGGTQLVFSDESEHLLGSAGGIRKALPFLDGSPFFLINADTLSYVNLSALEAKHAELRRSWGVNLTLAICPCSPRGEAYREILVDSKTNLIRGLGKLGQQQPFFVGVAVIEPEVLYALPLGQPSDFVSGILEPSIQEGRAGAYRTSGPWFDIGSPALWLKAHLALLNGLEWGWIPPTWRKRIERKNKRIAQNVWVSQPASRSRNFIHWAGPCYWNGLENPPEQLGPRAVLYGQKPSAAQELSDGIGLAGTWVSINSN